uniref:Transcription factor WRKY3 n=1 Tax=Diospyros kaki TaxID=35925 RepID=A0A2P1ENA8_DIOKA|nr:transcription factor WRKY3 [Diospyros kaki]
MEYISLLDTSLDLNANPMRFLDEAPINKGAENNFFELEKKTSVKEETSALVEELSRVSAENKKLTEMLTVLCENYNNLRSHLMNYASKNPDREHAMSRKRKAEGGAATNKNSVSNNGGNSESSSSDEDSCKKPREEHVKAKISRVCVRTEASDTSLVVKDGYQWRKYGQKVTRDNPCPRAYFKCSFAPACPVKKKVQRSVEDQSIVVATYEGEHNHPHPSRHESSTSSASRCVAAQGSVPCSASLAPTITLDLTKPMPNGAKDSSRTGALGAPDVQEFLVEQMASSLTKDPSFKAALAAAISRRIIQDDRHQTEKW